MLRLPCRAAVGVRTFVSCSRPLEAPFSPSVPAFAPKKKGPASTAVAEVFDLKKIVPVNILKAGTDPELKPETEYPEWLWINMEEKPLLSDYVLRGVHTLTQPEQKRVLRMFHKQAIKKFDAAHNKKKV